VDHPLIRQDPSAKDLRKRVVDLLQSGYSVPRSGNIIFVCGGNDAAHMRILFKDYCAVSAKSYQIFFPEFAMTDYFSNVAIEPFDIADFEVMVGELSHAIVLFPEAPGSFAETGYFALAPQMAKKTILVMDANRQHKDSFISMGPASKIGIASTFRPIVQVDYRNPDFSIIKDRIDRHHPGHTRKAFALSPYSAMSKFDLFGLIQKIVHLLQFARIDDIMYIMTALFSNRMKRKEIKQIASVLVGAEYMKQFGVYGYYALESSKKVLLEAREGFVAKEKEIIIEIREDISKSDRELQEMLKGPSSVPV